MGHRRGKGQILSADQLAERLAIPCYYIIQGKASAAFPYTSVPAPSGFVQIVRHGSLLRQGDASYFHVTVNWRQWNDIMVPVLEDPRWANWQGATGGETSLINGGIPTTPLGAGLFNDDIDTFLVLLQESIRQQAINCGFGSPEQTLGGSNPSD